MKKQSFEEFGSFAYMRACCDILEFINSSNSTGFVYSCGHNKRSLIITIDCC